MGRAAQARTERRARWALFRPIRMPRADTRAETQGRPARAAQERIIIADDGTRTEKGKDACIWLELDGVQLFSLPGDLLDAFTDGAAGAFTPPVPYTIQVTVLSTPTAAETAVARAFADVAPPTAALADLAGRLRAWWEDYLSGEYIPTHRFLLAITGPARAPQGTTLARVVGEVERTLHRLGVAARRLDGPAVRALVAAFPDPCADPAARETLDAVYLPGQGTRSWACTFYIRVPAHPTHPGWPAPLLAFPAPLRLSLHVTGLDQDKERTTAKKRGRSLGDLVVGAGAQGREADGDIGDARAEARAQARQMRTGGLAVVRAGIYVTVFAPDKDSLAVRADALWGLLTGTGAGALDARAARARGVQGPLLRATRPLGRTDAPRYTTYKMYAETVGNAWVAIVRSPGTAGGVLIGRAEGDGALVYLNIADRAFKNRLIDVFGGSGQGKSFFVQKFMLPFLWRDGWATAVDTVGGYETLCAIAGGTTVRLGGPRTAAINIWDGPRATEEERAARLYFVGKAHEVLLAESGKAITGRVRGLIDAGVAAVYAGHRDETDAGRTPDGTRRTAADPPLERDLLAWLETQARQPEQDHEDRRLYKDVAAELAPYARGGRYAPLVDRPTSFAFDTRLLAFHIDPRDLGTTTPVYAFVMFAMTDIADRRDALAQAWGRRSGRGTVQHLLAIDEGWSILRHQAGQEWVAGIGRTGRHSGMVPMFVSQKLSDLTSNAAAGYFDQTSLHFIFNMHDTNDESGVDPRQWIAGKLRLTDGEAARIGTLAGKEAADKKRLEYAQMFMIRTTKTASRPARGVVNVPSSPEEAWLFASDPDDKEYRARMVGAVAADPEHPTGEEVYQAVCLLAEGATPEEVYAARVVPAPDATAHADDGADDREPVEPDRTERGDGAWAAAR